MTVNRFGVDVSYFEHKMEIIIRDLDNYTPSQLYRELSRLANVAAPQGVITRDEIEARKRAVLNDYNK